MSAAEKLSPKDASAMFGGEDEAPEEPDDEGEGDDDLRTLGEAVLSAVSTGDALALAKAIRDLSGDKGEE